MLVAVVLVAVTLGLVALWCVLRWTAPPSAQACKKMTSAGRAWAAAARKDMIRRTMAKPPQ